jgi:hypothetical protein
LDARRAFDVADFIDDIWANALTRTGLGGPEGPEPDKPSRRSARHPISQENRK